MIQVLAAFAAMSTLLAAPSPVSQCTVKDPRLEELSGLVVNGSGMWALPDDGQRVYRINPDTCAITGSRSFTFKAKDTEDLARGPGGMLWVGNIGDNDEKLDGISVIEVPASGAAREHKLTYPDGSHNAEALLIDSQGRPVIITKTTGTARVYRTEKAPTGSGPTKLKLVGEVKLPSSNTKGGPDGADGSREITGAALSSDGGVVALRTYTDAWLFRVTGGDLVGALTSGKPTKVALPGQAKGEAIAFQRNGTLVSSGEADGDDLAKLQTVSGATSLVGRATR